MKKIKVACFGMQGFGNDLLHSLVRKNRVEVTALYTPSDSYEFRYYECEKIDEVAKLHKIPVHYIENKGDWKCAPAELAIISSFHRILVAENICEFEQVINIHPSILPSYRGATPTNWMIKNGEKIVGISAHIVEEDIDAGPVIFQKKMLNPFLNDAQLRKSLSYLGKYVVDHIVDNYPNYKEIKSEYTGSYFRPRKEKDGIIAIEDINSIEELIFHIKAFTNYPMPKIYINDRIFIVDYENPNDSVEIEICESTFNVLGKWENSY